MAALRRVKTGSLYDQGETLRVNGLDTWVVRAGPRGGVPVVFLHGVPTSAYVWREVMRSMHEEFDCVAFDWPGFGSSAKPRGLDVSHRARAGHLKALLEEAGLAKAHLVAHDLGAHAAILFALENPERVDRLVVLNTTLSKRDFRPPLPALTQFVPVVRDLARPLFTRPAFDFFFKEGLARPERVPREVLDHHWALAERDEGVHAVFDSWARLPESAAGLDELRGRIGAYKGRVLVLFGADDPYLPPPNAERLAKAFPHAELQLLAGAGHFLQEDAPEEVADRISAFLAGSP